MLPLDDWSGNSRVGNLEIEYRDRNIDYQMSKDWKNAGGNRQTNRFLVA